MTTVTEPSNRAAVPIDFVSGLEGVVAFTSDIAEPDKDGGALRYRGV
ncbi:citrate synthase, partial [Rhodococcus sp. NPDC019639]